MDMIPSTVNAYYNPPANEVVHQLPLAHGYLSFSQSVFPAGILQPPFFSVYWLVQLSKNGAWLTLDRPGYLNYGAFGQVAAHELTVR